MLVETAGRAQEEGQGHLEPEVARGEEEAAREREPVQVGIARHEGLPARRVRLLGGALVRVSFRVRVWVRVRVRARVKG